MQEVIDDFSKLELVKKNNSIGYGIIPPNLKNNLSIQKIEEIEENLDELMKYVQPASDPKSKTKPPKISSNDPINKYKSFLIDIGYDDGDDDELIFIKDLDKIVKAKDYKEDMENIKGLLNRLKKIIIQKKDEKTCKQCNFENDEDANFCKKCGKTLLKQTNQEKRNDDSPKVEEKQPESENIVCPSCKHPNIKMAKFCENCRFKLTDLPPKPKSPADEIVDEKPKTTKCPDCKEENEQGAKFCQKCRAKLSELKAAINSDTKECLNCTAHCPKSSNFCQICNHKFSAASPVQPPPIKENIEKICPKCSKTGNELSKFCEFCGVEMKPKNSVELKDCPDCTFKCPKEIEKCPSCEHKFKTLNRPDNQEQNLKVCPGCTTKCEIRLNFCSTCNYKFPALPLITDDQINNQSLVILCPNCKTENEKGDKFCSNCSHDLAFETKAKNNAKSDKPTKEDDLAARNLKTCGRCSAECEIKRNFCPACEFKFEKKEEPAQAEAINTTGESDKTGFLGTIVQNGKKYFKNHFQSDKIKCSKCDHKNEKTAKFCSSCGVKINLQEELENNVCPKCKKTIRINANFCEQCGHKVNEIVLDKPAEIIVNDTKCPNPKCNKENQIDAKFCEDCGQNMSAKKETVKAPVEEIKCPSCNKVNEKNSKFCGYCRKGFNEKVTPAPESDINTAGGMKSCPQCTLECEDRLNFCPACNNKF